MLFHISILSGLASYTFFYASRPRVVFMFINSKSNRARLEHPVHFTDEERKNGEERHYFASCFNWTKMVEGAKMNIYIGAGQELFKKDKMVETIEELRRLHITHLVFLDMTPFAVSITVKLLRPRVALDTFRFSLTVLGRLQRFI